MSNILPGFRFYPTEEELIGIYLRNKLENTRGDLERIMPVVDLYSYDPWQLPMISGELCRNDATQWFFFSPRHDREVHGGRPNRITPSGYWKATGSPNFVYSSNNRLIGAKKTMVFYEGRAPSGTKTEWKMNEYRAIYEATEASTCPRSDLEDADLLQNQSQEFSLCRIYKGSGLMRSFDRRPLPSPEQTQILEQHEGRLNVEQRNIIPDNHGEIFPSQACNGMTEINNSHRNSASTINFQDSFHEETVDWEMTPDFFLWE